jgi:hypothetical protein
VSPRRISDKLVQESPALHRDDTIERAVERLLDSGLPALPVIDERGRLCGIFGEREFMAALFPGYVRQLGYAGFVPRKLDDALETRAACRGEPVADHMNPQHIDVGEVTSSRTPTGRAPGLELCRRGAAGQLLPQAAEGVAVLHGEHRPAPRAPPQHAHPELPPAACPRRERDLPQGASGTTA